MSEGKPKIEELVKALQDGEIKPGSAEGIDAIRQISAADVSIVAKRLFNMPNRFLEKGMLLAGVTQDRIDELLGVDGEKPLPQDPFAGDVEASSDGNDHEMMSPMPDPMSAMRRGPRPR